MLGASIAPDHSPISIWNSASIGRLGLWVAKSQMWACPEHSEWLSTEAMTVRNFVMTSLCWLKTAMGSLRSGSNKPPMAALSDGRIHPFSLIGCQGCGNLFFLCLMVGRPPQGSSRLQRACHCYWLPEPAVPDAAPAWLPADDALVSSADSAYSAKAAGCASIHFCIPTKDSIQSDPCTDIIFLAFNHDLMMLQLLHPHKGLHTIRSLHRHQGFFSIDS